MSSFAGEAAEAPAISTRRALTARQAETVGVLVDAAVDELRATGYEGLTVRNVARRAGVAPATAYTYFASKDHLITEAYWRRLAALPETSYTARARTETRVSKTLADLALLVADEPHVASACTLALLGTDPDVAALRVRIGSEMRRRIARALTDHGTDDGTNDGTDGDRRPRPDAQVLRTLEMALTGGMVQAGMGHVTYDDLPAMLADVTALVLRGRGGRT
jgi:AcrR family transcriptional regulator